MVNRVGTRRVYDLRRAAQSALDQMAVKCCTRCRPLSDVRCRGTCA
jgi:hypothetical protein